MDAISPEINFWNCPLGEVDAGAGGNRLLKKG